MNEEKKFCMLEEEKLDKVTGGAQAHLVEDESGKTHQLIRDDDDPIGIYEVSTEGVEDPNARAKSLGQ